MTKVISGTKEWSVASCNIQLGCGHRCRYCYARSNALRRGQIKTADEWGTTYYRIRPKEVTKRRKKVDGRIMFPTTHDLEPQFLGECLKVIENQLAAGNQLLIVSKPHLECIRAVCDLSATRMFDDPREQIEFRFTIGAIDHSVLSYWEPGAPVFNERLASLRLAFESGYPTSVSMEPLLDSASVDELVETVSPFVTGTIWIGMMNQIDSRVIDGTAPAAIERMKAGQTPERVAAVYESLKDHPQIRWKESYKKVLGLDLATEAGQDV